MENKKSNVYNPATNRHSYDYSKKGKKILKYIENDKIYRENTGRWIMRKTLKNGEKYYDPKMKKWKVKTTAHSDNGDNGNNDEQNNDNDQEQNDVDDEQHDGSDKRYQQYSDGIEKTKSIKNMSKKDHCKNIKLKYRKNCKNSKNMSNNMKELVNTEEPNSSIQRKKKHNVEESNGSGKNKKCNVVQTNKTNKTNKMNKIEEELDNDIIQQYKAEIAKYKKMLKQKNQKISYLKSNSKQDNQDKIDKRENESDVNVEDQNP